MVLTISSSSARTKSYADNATQKIMAVTPSKQWIHFFLSDLCPPTSNILENESYKLVITMIMSHTLNILHTEMTEKSRWVTRWQSARCKVHFVQYIEWYLLMHLFSCVSSKYNIFRKIIPSRIKFPTDETWPYITLPSFKSPKFFLRIRYP